MTDYSNIPIIVIGGPTAVGKTAFSIEVAKAINGEIINGDSLQVYRALTIGTGKILPTEMENISHHLLDILEPDAQFDASQFKKLATQKIVEIYHRGKIPIIVGGTGLYLEGLLYGLTFGGTTSQDLTVRQQIELDTQTLSDEQLWVQLNNVDPMAAQKIPHQNRRRLIRALEVIAVTGQLFSQQSEHEAQQDVFNTCLIVLNMPREQLYERINQRVEKMIQDGLEQEVYNIYQKYQGELVNGTKGIGYKEWWPYFKGQISLADVKAQIQQNSRRYAKRQLTWFRNRLKNVHWLDANKAIEQGLPIIQQHLSAVILKND